MSDAAVLVEKQTLLDLITSIFQHHGASFTNALASATALIEAEAAGQNGHGLSRVESYCAQLDAGKVKGQVTPKVLERQVSGIRIDAQNGFAYPALDLAFNELTTLNKTAPIAAAAITESHHAGALGLLSERFAHEGLITLIFANTPKAIAPYGGKNPLFGTNPIAFGAPQPNGEPIIIDMALSNVARGKILDAQNKGETIPEGWALDKEGNPTTEPEKALAGSMIAIGEAKGYGLILMVEILAAALTGSTASFKAESLLNAEGGAPAVGQFIISIDPNWFSGGTYDAIIDEIVSQITAEPGARLPGEKRIQSRQQIALQGGFLLPKARYEQLLTLNTPTH